MSRGYVVSFSGGRTSGYLVKKEDDDGRLSDPGSFVIFCNTGRELDVTLAFVRDVQMVWDVPVRWVEWRPYDMETASRAYYGLPKHRRDALLPYLLPNPLGFKEVDFETAARNGEPFEVLIASRGMLPNVRARYCTGVLKADAKRNFMRAHGYSDDEWVDALGIRADEPRRVARHRQKGNTEGRWEVTMPLVDAGVTVLDVRRFWRSQSFDLGIQGPWEGNCDGCFLKRVTRRLRMCSDYPERMVWWAEQEKAAMARPYVGPTGSVFRLDGPSFTRLLKQAGQPWLFPEMKDDTYDDSEDFDVVDCACGDGQ